MKKKVQKISKRILCLMLAFCVSSSAFVSFAVSKETQDQIDKTKIEQQKAKEQQAALEKEQNRLNSKLKETEKHIKELEAQSDSLADQIEALTMDILEKEEELKIAEAEVAKQYMDMKRRIQYMYENSSDTLITYLTAAVSRGITAMLNQIEYASNINSYDRTMLDNYKAAKEELEAQKQALALLKEENEKKQEEVLSRQKEAGNKVDEFESLLEKKETELLTAEELVEEKTRLLNELIAKAEEEERVAKILAAQNAASSMNGVTIIAGDAKISRHHITLSDEEMLWLAVMIYCEAGNQGYDGQIAVGNVIMNRVRSAKFPNTLKGVLTAAKQFEPYGSGKFDLILRAEKDPDIPNKVTSSCWQAARDCVNKAVDNASNVGDSLFFRTWKPVPQLITNLEAGGVPYWIIKDHIFYYYWTSYSNKPSTPSTPSDSNKDEDKDDEKDDNKQEEQKPVEKPDDQTGKENETENKDQTGNENETENKDQTGNGNETENKDQTGNGNETENKDQTGNGNETENKDQTGNGNGTGNKDQTGTDQQGNPVGEGQQQNGQGTLSGQSEQEPTE